MLVLINKTDLVEQRMTQQHILQALDVEDLEGTHEGGKATRQVAVRECSAAKSEGIWESLSELHEMMSEREQDLSKNVKIHTLKRFGR